MLILCMFIFAGQALAVNEVEVTLENPGFSASDEFYIDIYAVSTEDDFELGDSRLRFSINTSVLSIPDPPSALSEQNSSFHSNSLYEAMSVSATGNYVDFEVTATGGTGTVLPNTATRLARITFAINTSTYKTETSDIDSRGELPETSVKTADEVDPVFLVFGDSYSKILDCKPVLSGTPVISIVQNESYSFTPTLGAMLGDGSAVDGSCSVTFSIQNQPSWASFDPVDGGLSGTATPVDTYSNIIISVTEDIDGDADSLSSFSIEVTDTSSSGGGSSGGGGCFITGLRP
jgi:hypothetical protein